MQYKIEGTPMPVVVCTLENGETMITESGAMSWMTPNMKMETTSGGGVGKVFSRMMSGESLFLNRYTAQNGQGMIAFASSFPGSMRAINISANQGMIVQKSAFLAAESGVQLSIAFQKKLVEDSLVEKVLLCNVYQVRAQHLLKLTDTPWNTYYNLGKV